MTLHSPVKSPRLWGYAGVFPGEFGTWKGDAELNKLRFAAQHGFEVGSIGLKAFSTPERTDEIRAVVDETGLQLSIHFGLPYFSAPPEEVREKAGEVVEKIAELGKTLPIALVTTCVGPYHRFQREPSLEFQMERLHQALSIVAGGLATQGLRTGIENHGDYYVSDLVKLCEVTPPLGIFLDTGNCYLIGERPVEGCGGAAKYVVGTHFKDHFVEPEPKTLTFKLTGASFGDGHVGLEEIYQDLINNHPDPASLVMEFELVPDKSMCPLESLERSKQFVARLRGRPFPPVSAGELVTTGA